MNRVQIEEASADDIIGLTGIESVSIGETICSNEDGVALSFIPIDSPTIRMQFAVNDGPFAEHDGNLLTARHILERLEKEIRTNISLRVSPTSAPNIFDVEARGEMQIATLVEQMRREGCEALVSRPEVIFHRDDDGKLMEPIEKLFLEIPQTTMGAYLRIFRIETQKSPQ
ncbi:MAG: GTP-binding protein TypA/BipA [Verrucomicrobia subdivision 3 bacterium]|nr:GTP-binding protein TypA/BipA [Limisphaerales bacterium]MCS1416779.1 GTP-binding protein TypA/BipA [Limisphaerales bacterium]